MALVAPTIATIISGNLSAAQILGVTQGNLAAALSSAFVSHLLADIVVTTADVGISGSGTGVGQGVIVAPPVFQGTLTGSFSGNGILGVFQQPLILALSNAYSQSLLTATINTIDTGVGVGSGSIVSVAANTVAHVAVLTSMFAAYGLGGVFAAPLIAALATGIDAALLSSKGFTVIAGGGSPPPSVGFGVGKLS